VTVSQREQKTHLFPQLVLEPVCTELDNVGGLLTSDVAVKVVEDGLIGRIRTGHVGL